MTATPPQLRWGGEGEALQRSCRHRLLAAAAEQRVGGRLADLFQDLPATGAFVAVREQRLDGDTRDVGQGEGTRRTLAVDQLAARGDGDFGEVEALEGCEIL